MSWLLWIIHRLHWEQGKLLPIRAVGSVDYPEQPGPSLRGTLNQESLQSTCQIHPKHTVYRCVEIFQCRGGLWSYKRSPTLRSSQSLQMLHKTNTDNSLYIKD